ncbi:MerR family transcriptional regulator [Paenibacillus swuensis]|uniref:MerR family transcriptional regulator n=1 Tax=Paenibacillus swuensis TaxID=1178515 RepID=A0A172TL84_9BACL|nr:MerR family transcriptional regulator [Paenibacillus swuensis]ANE47742.1 MerR family transcriptional regulator [Paenibacillus swuensis]
MNVYTAKQIADVLQNDDSQINLRTVRYYTQIGIIPPLELVGNKRMYTDIHLHHFRAILALSKSGETLASAQEKLKCLSMEDIIKIGENLRIYQINQLLQNETHVVNEDVIISMSPRIPQELRAKMIETVAHLLKGEGVND